MSRRTRRRVARAAVVVAAFGAVSAYAATRPDPLAQAAADGCKRDRIGIFLGRGPNWVYVNDKDYPATGPPPPPQTVTGVVSSQYTPWDAAHPTSVDMPTTHSSYDFTFNVRPTPGTAYLVGGDPARGVGNFSARDQMYGRLHVEWEEGAFPLWAWPERGDRVVARGSWVWDCDHAEGGEHTEIHPPRAVWVERNPGGPSPNSPRGEAEAALYVSTDKTPAGTQADCAHRTKGDEAAFRACVRSDANWQDVSGRYSFLLAAPAARARGAKLRVRVVDRGSTRGVRVRAVAVRGQRPGARVTLTLRSVPNRRLVVAKQIFVGWSAVPAARLPARVRVTVRRLTVRRAMDPGCPSGNQNCTTPQTTRKDQISRGPGEFALYLDVAGRWSRWRPVVVRAGDGQTVRGGPSVTAYVPKRGAWRIFVRGRECDNGVASARGQRPLAPCPRSTEFPGIVGDDDPGFVELRFTSLASALGIHRVDSTPGGSCPIVNRRGCYRLELEVRRTPR